MRPKNQSAGISKAITPEMSIEEKWRVATLGDLEEFEPLYLQLIRLYWADTGTDEKVAATAQLGAWFAEELKAGNEDFFHALAKLIPIAKKQWGAVSRLESTLLMFQGMREGTLAGDDYPGLSAADCEEWKKVFPIWPATISELQAAISKGFPCDEKTLRDAVKRLGYPVRKAILGAPKKK